MSPSAKAKIQQMPAMPAEQDAQFNAAKQLYAEQFGDAVVTNTYLKITILILSLVVVIVLAIAWRTVKVVQDFKPLVIRVDQVGRAEAVRYDNFAYKPQEAEIKYFLSDFCRLYYSRNKLTIRDNFPKSVLFMDQQLGSSVVEAWTRDHTIENYFQNSQYDQDVEIQRVSIEDLRQAPYKASVDYQLIYYTPVDRRELKRVQYTAHFVFSFRDTVPNDIIQVNPLGLAISYFREDEAFH